MHSQAWVGLSKMVVILKPHRHAQFISRTSCYRIIASTWIVGAGVGSFPTMWKLDLCTINILTNGRSLSAL